jgi:hypothetical protein
MKADISTLLKPDILILRRQSPSITASNLTFATDSLFNFPMTLSRPLVGILAYKRCLYPMNWNTNGG